MPGLSRHQLLVRYAQRLANLEDRDNRWIATAALKATDILLAEAGPLRQLLLRQPRRQPGIAHIRADEFPHIHRAWC